MKQINAKAHITLATPSKFLVTSMSTPDTKAPTSPTNTNTPPHVPEYVYSVLNTTHNCIPMRPLQVNVHNIMI